MARNKSSAEKDISCADVVERSMYVFDQVNSWIQNADNKVSISCGIFTGVFGVITFLAEKVTAPTAKTTINECCRGVYRTSFILSLILMGLSILLYVMAINPNIKSNKAPTVKKKMRIFFCDIADINLGEYKKLMNNASDDDFCEELLNEVHFNSKICTRKMQRYRKGLWLSFAAVVMAGLSWAAHFLMYR
jgi:hypothetical protein